MGTTQCGNTIPIYSDPDLRVGINLVQKTDGKYYLDDENPWESDITNTGTELEFEIFSTAESRFRADRASDPTFKVTKSERRIDARHSVDNLDVVDNFVGEALGSTADKRVRDGIVVPESDRKMLCAIMRHVGVEPNSLCEHPRADHLPNLAILIINHQGAGIVGPFGPGNATSIEVVAAWIQMWTSRR